MSWSVNLELLLVYCFNKKIIFIVVSLLVEVFFLDIMVMVVIVIVTGATSVSMMVVMMTVTMAVAMMMMRATVTSMWLIDTHNRVHEVMFFFLSFLLLFLAAWNWEVV